VIEKRKEKKNSTEGRREKARPHSDVRTSGGFIVAFIVVVVRVMKASMMMNASIVRSMKLQRGLARSVVTKADKGGVDVKGVANLAHIDVSDEEVGDIVSSMGV